MAWGGKTGLDIEFCAEFPKFDVVELFAIVRDNGLRNPETTHNGLPDELSGIPLSNLGKGFNFDPLSEIINGDYGKFYLAPTGQQGAHEIDSPFSEETRATDRDQLRWRDVGDVSEALAFVAFHHKISGVLTKCGPKVTCSKNFMSQRPSSRVIAINSLVYFSHDIDCLIIVEASKVQL